MGKNRENWTLDDYKRFVDKFLQQTWAQGSFLKAGKALGTGIQKPPKKSGDPLRGRKTYYDAKGKRHKMAPPPPFRGIGIPVDPKVGSGICSYMAAKWIEVKLLEISQWSTGTSANRIQQMTDSFFEMSGTQKKYGPKSPLLSKKFDEGVQEKLKIKKAQINYVSLLRKGKSGDSYDIAAVVNKRSRSCYLYTFYTGKAGHGIAFYRSWGLGGFGQNVYVFDPNRGEYKVPATTFGDWLKYFRIVTYGQTKHGSGDQVTEYRLN